MENNEIAFRVENPIYGKESEELENKIRHLIGRHNVLCRIEEAFKRNKVALAYFNEAREEVLESGNYSVASMYAIAIDGMSNRLNDLEEDEKETADINILRNRIYLLEAQNRKLTTKIENITKVVNA